MALSNIQRYTERPRGRSSYPVRNGAVVYAGALVGIEPASGRIAPWTSSSGVNLFLGIAEPKLEPVTLGTAPTSVTGNSAGTVECDVNESGPVLVGISVTGAVAASLGDPVYASDDNTFTMTATSNVGAIGRLVRFVSATNCDVELFTPAEYMGVDDAGQV